MDFADRLRLRNGITSQLRIGVRITQPLPFRRRLANQLARLAVAEARKSHDGALLAKAQGQIATIAELVQATERRLRPSGEQSAPALAKSDGQDGRER
jgi:hypothetical protein